MKQQKKPFPLRMDDDVREAAEALATSQDRSLNWQLNDLLKAALANIAAQKENATVAVTTAASM
ncbi:MAG: toxin-antitoxin system HicB family antitoxin [Pseudomonadota bacterium]